MQVHADLVLQTSCNILLCKLFHPYSIHNAMLSLKCAVLRKNSDIRTPIIIFVIFVHFML
nr:MAG TPA: hypothetical protein [Caudoviricetes sp.]